MNDLKVGSKVGIQLTENGTVLLSVDGVKDDEILPSVLLSNQPAYAFFDLYGQCQQVSCIIVIFVFLFFYFFRLKSLIIMLAKRPIWNQLKRKE